LVVVAPSIEAEEALTTCATSRASLSATTCRSPAGTLTSLRITVALAALFTTLVPMRPLTPSERVALVELYGL